MLRAASLCLLAASAWADDVPTGLLVDFQKSPALGVRLVPRFGWIVPPCASAPDQQQVSYAITVYATGGAVVWASGSVADTDSTYALYAGPPLNASTPYTWTVATATTSCTSPPSAPAAFVTALGPAGFAPPARFISLNASATFGYYRAEVPLGGAADPVVSAVAHITAGNENSRLLCAYKLYINDALVNVGPGRGEAPVWGGDGLFHGMAIQTLDVTAALGGAAPTAVLALQAMSRPAGGLVIMQLTLYLASGATRTLVTDASWLAFNADAHRVPTPGSGSAGVGFIEHIDARAEPVGWRSAGFSPDARWGPALAAPPTPAQLGDLHDGMKPPLQVLQGNPVVSLRPVPPPPPPAPSGPVLCGLVPEGNALLLGGCSAGNTIDKIVFASWGTPGGYCPDHLTRNASCDSATALAAITAACVGKASCTIQASREALGDPCYDVLKSLAVQVSCTGPAPPPPPPSNSTPVSYVAVFEKEFQGGLRLDVTNGTAGSTATVSCGESLVGDSVRDDWGWRFVWTLRDGAQTLEQHKYMECRFVSITFSAPVDFALTSWIVHYPWAEEDSSFSSSNDTLDAVYDLCRYTVHSASLDTYTDSNTRERTPYEADGIIAASGRLLVQRDYLYGRHSHAYVLQNPTWPVEWKQITPFLAWQDYQATGQPDFALAFSSTLFERTFYSFLDNATGVLRTDKMGPHIVDWMPDGGERDETVQRGEFTASPHMSVTNGFAARGLDMMAQMSAAGGAAANASAYAAAAASLKAAIVQHMWNGSYFCDGICSEVQGNSRVMTNMFFLAFGLVPAGAATDSAWQVVADWGLQQIGDYGAFWYQLALASSYYGAPYDTPDDGTAMVTALAKCDLYSWCSGLRDDNLTMTRESWHDGTYSHGWGSSAILGVSLGVMGIHQTAPGFAAFTVKPKLGPLTHASITVPTLRGYINVTAGPATGTVSVQVPCNTLATLCTPRSARDGSVLRTLDTHLLLLDGAPVSAVAAAGHLCTAAPVSCGAGGAFRVLSAQPR